MPDQEQREMTPEENERYQRLLKELPPMTQRRMLRGEWLPEDITLDMVTIAQRLDALEQRCKTF